MNASLRILSSKADSNTWESFTRSELKLESVNQESPRSDIFKKRATKPLLNQKHRQKHLTWAKDKKNWTVAQWSKVLFQMKVNFAFNLEIKVWSLEEEWRGTESKLLEVQCEVSEVSDNWGAVISAGPLCFIKSIVNAAVYQEDLEHFMLLVTSFMEMLRRDYGDADFIFQQDFNTCPHCQNHFQVICWPWYYCAWLASQRTWPEPHTEYFQEKDEKQSMQR